MVLVVLTIACSGEVMVVGRKERFIISKRGEACEVYEEIVILFSFVHLFFFNEAEIQSKNLGE